MLDWLKALLGLRMHPRKYREFARNCMRNCQIPNDISLEDELVEVCNQTDGSWRQLEPAMRRGLERILNRSTNHKLHA